MRSWSNSWHPNTSSSCSKTIAHLQIPEARTHRNQRKKKRIGDMPGWGFTHKGETHRIIGFDTAAHSLEALKTPATEKSMLLCPEHTWTSPTNTSVRKRVAGLWVLVTLIRYAPPAERGGSRTDQSPVVVFAVVFTTIAARSALTPPCSHRNPCQSCVACATRRVAESQG